MRSTAPGVQMSSRCVLSAPPTQVFLSALLYLWRHYLQVLLRPFGLDPHMCRVNIIQYPLSQLLGTTCDSQHG